MPNNQVQQHTSATPAIPASQGTQIEQSRAIAEVQAAVVVAQQCPRNLEAAIRQMRESCHQPILAQRAFFRFPRAGGQVTGPTIHLARELARCWGNIQYGITELRRDDAEGVSEMQAYAWDVQTNTRSAQIFIVPHIRDKRGGGERLTEMRDIYENNANMGARRVREAIFAVLPPWFTEEAKSICIKTLEGDVEKPLAQRVADAVAKFENQGITADQLEAKIGAPRNKWTGGDIASLIVIFQSLANGESNVSDEFPPRRVTVEEVTAPRAPAKKSPAPAPEPVNTSTGEVAPDYEQFDPTLDPEWAATH